MPTNFAARVHVCADEAKRRVVAGSDLHEHAPMLYTSLIAVLVAHEPAPPRDRTFWEGWSGSGFRFKQVTTP